MDENKELRRMTNLTRSHENFHVKRKGNQKEATKKGRKSHKVINLFSAPEKKSEISQDKS